MGKYIIFVDDFGNDWEHELTIEDSRYFDSELRCEIICIDGAGACPPEDVGGVPGYYEFCKALKDPDHEEHGSLVEWAWRQYDDLRHYSIGLFLNLASVKPESR